MNKQIKGGGGERKEGKREEERENWYHAQHVLHPVKGN